MTETLTNLTRKTSKWLIRSRWLVSRSELVAHDSVVRSERYVEQFDAVHDDGVLLWHDLEGVLRSVYERFQLEVREASDSPTSSSRPSS